MLAKFLVGVCAGFYFSISSSVLCEVPPRRGVSPDGLTNYTFEDVALPTEEELSYVKTWGVSWVKDWDRPGLRGISKSSGVSAKRQIILVRHGQYQNARQKDDRVHFLTPLGEMQARLTGEYLWKAFVQSGFVRESKLGMALENSSSNEVNVSTSTQERSTNNHMGGFLVAPQPKFIHSSDMTRAKQTASFILEAFPTALRKGLATDPFLRERYPCDPEPRPRRGSATYDDMRIVEKTFEKYFYRPAFNEDSVEIIVGHANVIRYLVCRALQLPPEAWLRISLPHCSLTSIIINAKGHVSLSSLGSVGHLPVDMVTTRNIP